MRTDKVERSPLRLRGAWWLAGMPLLAFLVLPPLTLFLWSVPSEVAASLAQPAAYRAIRLSVETSLVALVLTVALGTPLALLVARRDFPLRRFVNVAIDLPMVLPPAVAGVALLLAFGRNGFAGRLLAEWGVQISFTQTAVVMAQVFVAAPFFVRAATIGLRRINDALEEAALLDGASTWQVLRYVTFPLARPALVGGAVLAWARALGEFGATILFAGNLPGRTQTMPLAIYLGFELDARVAVTLAVVLMLVSFAVLGLVRYTLDE